MLRLKHALFSALLALTFVVDLRAFADFVSDTFTGSAGTELSTHSSDVGGAWTEQASTTSGEFVLTDANRARPNNTGFGVYLNAGTPASAEYDVSVTLRQVTSVSDQLIGVVGRAETLDRTWYEAYYSKADGQWSMAVRVDNVATPLGTPFTQSLSNDTDYLLTLQIRNATKKVLIDGVERITSTNNDITAAGVAGLIQFTPSGASTNSTGFHIDNFLASDQGGGSPSPCRLLLLGVGCL